NSFLSPFDLSTETQTAFAGADATFGMLPQLAMFMTNTYWQGPPNNPPFNVVPVKWPSGSIAVNITSLTTQDQVLARDALAAWAAVANLKFTETAGPADITYNDGGSKIAGTNVVHIGGVLQPLPVQISADYAAIGNGPDGVGSYLFQTYLHETGHALGLGHVGPYNSDGKYGVNNIFTNDTYQYSVMSYFEQANFMGSSNASLVTPQMADILAIQNLYGASTTPVGNTTYGFNSTAGPLYNFRDYPNGNVPAFTIFNTGANNTLDASGFSQDQTINLNPGTWSSIGGLVNNNCIYTTTNIPNSLASNPNT